MSKEFVNAGEHPLIVEWDESVPIVHRKIVESGLFDRVPRNEKYEFGDVVVSRYSDKILQVYEDLDDGIVVGYDTEKECVRETLSKKDIIGIDSYAQLIYQIAQPTTEIRVDKRGHTQIKYRIPKYRDIPNLS